MGRLRVGNFNVATSGYLISRTLRELVAAQAEINDVAAFDRGPLCAHRGSGLRIVSADLLHFVVALAFHSADAAVQVAAFGQQRFDALRHRAQTLRENLPRTLRELAQAVGTLASLRDVFPEAQAWVPGYGCARR